jgi:hypothetical protein
MKNLFRIFVFTATLLMGANALAVIPGLYIAGQAGLVRFDNTGNRLATEFSAGANLGYNFKVTDRILLAPELGFDYLGQPNLRSGITNLTGPNTVMAYNLLGAVTYNLNSTFDIFAKAGFTRHSWDVAAYLRSNGIRNVSISDPTPMLATGFGYSLAQNVQTYLQWNHVFGSGSGTSNYAHVVDAFYVGLRYSFGSHKTN